MNVKMYPVQSTKRITIKPLQERKIPAHDPEDDFASENTAI